MKLKGPTKKEAKEFVDNLPKIDKQYTVFWTHTRPPYEIKIVYYADTVLSLKSRFRSVIMLFYCGFKGFHKWVENNHNFGQHCERCNTQRE